MRTIERSSAFKRDYKCHIKPDLLLIYRKPDADTLRLARLGSHSELFG
jgi:mRNA interferase YafQ